MADPQDSVIETRVIIRGFSSPLMETAFDSFMLTSRTNGLILGCAASFIVVSLGLAHGLNSGSAEMSTHIGSAICLAVFLGIFVFAAYVRSNEYPPHLCRWVKWVCNVALVIMYVIVVPASMLIDQQLRNHHRPPCQGDECLSWEGMAMGLAICLLTPMAAAILLCPPFWIYVLSCIMMNTVFMISSHSSTEFKMMLVFCVFFIVLTVAFIEWQKRGIFVNHLTQKRLNNENERARKSQIALLQEQAAEEAFQTDIIGAAMHDLRTPMCTLALGCKRLLSNCMDGDGPETNREKIDEVLNSILVASQVSEVTVDNLLTTRRLLGKYPLIPDLRLVNLRPIVEKHVDLTKSAFGQKGVECMVFVHSEVPELVVTDMNWIEQMLMNLLINALKHTVQGTVECTVHVIENGQMYTQSCATRTADPLDIPLIVVMVKDSGKGIRPELKADLFRKPVAPTMNGPGIGLYTVGAKAAVLGGACGHSANPSGGSLFWFVVPLCTNMEALQRHSLPLWPPGLPRQ